MTQDIGAVGHSGVTQQSHRNHLLLKVERLVVGCDDERKLLIPRGDVAGGRDVEKQRRENILQAVLVAAIDGVVPGIFNLLKLRKVGGRRRSDRTMGRSGCRCRGRIGDLRKR